VVTRAVQGRGYWLRRPYISGRYPATHRRKGAPKPERHSRTGIDHLLKESDDDVGIFTTYIRIVRAMTS